MLCADGPNLAYSKSCYNSIGYPVSSFPQICPHPLPSFPQMRLHFPLGIWGKSSSDGSWSNFCQGSWIAMHLPPTHWLETLQKHSKSNTCWEAGCVTEKQLSPVCLMCWTSHMDYSLVEHTQFVFKVFRMHHTFKAITHQTCISIQAIRKEILEILIAFSPEGIKVTWWVIRTQDPSDIILAKLGSFSKAATTYQLTQWHP